MEGHGFVCEEMQHPSRLTLLLARDLSMLLSRELCGSACRVPVLISHEREKGTLAQHWLNTGSTVQSVVGTAAYVPPTYARARVCVCVCGLAEWMVHHVMVGDETSAQDGDGDAYISLPFNFRHVAGMRFDERWVPRTLPTHASHAR